MYEQEGATPPVVETLPNGIILVNDYLPGRLNASISVEVLRGSRDDPQDQAGGHHVVEHILWRACARYPSFQLIADAIEDHGGISMAVTDRECTKFKVNLPAEKLGIGAEVLAALITSPLFMSADVENVRNVILEEIRRYNDHAPEWIAHHIPSIGWGAQHPMGRPVFGAPESVANMTNIDLVTIFEKSYVGNAMAVVVSGGARLDYEIANLLFGGIPKGALTPRSTPNWLDGVSSLYETREGLENSYWATVLPGVTSTDPGKLAYFVMSEILQERLDRTVRERDGLTYGIETNFETFQDCGLFTVQSSSEPKAVKKAIAGSISEIRKLALEGPTQLELTRQKQRNHGSLLRYIETPNGLNNHWGEQLAMGRQTFLTPMQIDSRVMALTLDEVHVQARRLAKELAHLRLIAVASEELGPKLELGGEQELVA